MTEKLIEPRGDLKSEFIHIPKEKLSEILKIGIIVDVGWAGNDVVFQVLK